MEQLDIESLNSYLATKPHSKILSSLIISCIYKCPKISSTNSQRLLTLFDILKKLRFFEEFGHYSIYESLINESFTIINTINCENGVQSFIGFSESVKIKIDKQIDLFKGFPECKHEATRIFWGPIIKDSLNLNEIKFYVKEFLEVFDQNTVDVMSDFLKKLIKFLNIKRSTWLLHHIYPQNLDDFFQNVWFTMENPFLLHNDSFNHFLNNSSVSFEKKDDFNWADERSINEEEVKIELKNLLTDTLQRLTSKNGSPKFFNSSPTSEDFNSFIIKMTEIHHSDDPQDNTHAKTDRSEELKQSYCSFNSKSRNTQEFRIFLKVIEGPYKHSNNADLSYGSEIEIFHNRIVINKQMEKKHDRLIKFGRKSKQIFNEKECNVLFPDEDKYISTNQFYLIVQENDVFIQCVSPPPKPMTAFKICNHPFFLKKDHVICFSEKLAFHVYEISIKPVYISFRSFNLYMKNDKIEKTIYKFGDSTSFLLGSIEPLKHEALQKYEIYINYHKNKGWYITGMDVNDPNFRDFNFQSLVYLMDYEQLYNKSPSSRYKLEEGMIFRVGSYSLLVNEV